MRLRIFTLYLALASAVRAIAPSDDSSPPFTISSSLLDPSLSSRLDGAGKSCFQLNPSPSCAGWPPSATDLAIADRGICVPTQGSQRSFYIRTGCPDLDVYVCAEAGCGDHEPVVVRGSAGGCYDVVPAVATDGAVAKVWQGVSVSVHHDGVLYGTVAGDIPLRWIIPFAGTFLGAFIIANVVFLVYMVRAYWKDRR